ncbi:hypothetical protein D9615_010014 [Tricholomella constricta]|uniref:F-box domain-containing protein n=1 Tax=Tricholomella constricta TaxID=117010 RepID=A0A8H5GTP9_9AGAR|nr:hypothetical protein D9615_010014 [Tricholomella constricta]
MVLSSFIPEDIISTILDELSDDVQSLKRCSLVSQSFLPHCHKILFSYICLNHPTRSRGLYHMVTNNASFTPYIRTVEIISSAHPEFDDHDWVTMEPTLAPLLWTLHNLHAFTLRKKLLSHLPWNTLPGDLRSAILGLSVPAINLTCVTNVPMGHFGRLVCLKKLSLIRIGSDQGHALDLGPLDASSPPSPLQPVGYLESLNISDSPTCGRHLVTTLTDTRSLLKLSRLKDLEMYGDHDFVGTIMEAAGQSLQSVFLSGLGKDRAYHPSPFIGLPSFSTLPALRSLRIITTFTRGHPHDPLPLLAQALAGATPRDTCALQELFIYINLYHVWDVYITPGNVTALEEYAFWPAFDEALARPGAYPKLEKVVVGLLVGCGKEAFAELPKRRMPMLLERGVLELTL